MEDTLFSENEESFNITSIPNPLDKLLEKYRFSKELKNNLSSVTCIVLPTEIKVGGNYEIFFEQGSLDLYNFLKSRDKENFVEILCDDENYQEIVKYDNTLFLPALLLLNDFLKEVTIGLIVDYIKEYVSSKVGVGKIDISIINQSGKNNYDEIKYKGSIKNFSKALNDYIEYKRNSKKNDS